MNWQHHLYGNLTGDQIRRTLAAYRELWGLSQRVLLQVRQNPMVFEVAGEEVSFPWAELYAWPLNRVLAMLAIECGMGQEIIEIAKSDNPTAAFVERYAEDDETPDTGRPGVIYAFCCVCNANLRSMALYSRTMSSLVDDFDDPERGMAALDKAIWLDPTILSLPSAMKLFIAARQAKNQYMFNRFLQSLRNGPDKRKISNMELRWLACLLADIGAFESCSQKEIFDLVVNGLGLYRHDGDKGDAFQSLFGLFRTWRKEIAMVPDPK